MNETLGSVVSDSSAYGNHGTARSGALPTGDGRFGSARTFDGTIEASIMIPLTDSLNFGAGAFTAEVWVKTTTGSQTGPSERQLFHTTAPGHLWSLGLNIDNLHPGVPSFSFYDNNLGPVIFATSAVNDGEWHHLAGVRIGGLAKLYVDGVLEGSIDVGGLAQADQDSGWFEIGGAGFPPGVVIDEVRLSNKARGPQEFNVEVPVPSMVSLDNPFGPGTLTLDTTTGLQWLDLTLSTAYSYDQILLELASGGVFEGYRLATQDEILALWANAGINVGSGFLGEFTAENFQSIVNLMAFAGVTGANTGNLRGGNFFDFSAGHIESGLGGSGFVTVATLAADPDPTVTGRPSFGGVPSDNNNNEHGSWLVAIAAVPPPTEEPVITQQPGSVEASEGQPVVLSVGAFGSALIYQWFKGEGAGRTAIPGATQATLAIPSTQATDTGSYSVDVMNSGGTATSSFVTVSVVPNVSAPQGLITAKAFLSITGTSVANLTGNAKFPDSPDVLQFFEYFEWAATGNIVVPPGAMPASISLLRAVAISPAAGTSFTALRSVSSSQGVLRG